MTGAPLPPIPIAAIFNLPAEDFAWTRDGMNPVKALAAVVLLIKLRRLVGSVPIRKNTENCRSVFQ
jgi:hypothetical protein